MEAVLALVSGLLFSSGLYCVLQGHLVRIIAGIVLLSNAVNLLIFSVGRIKKRLPPLITDGEQILWPTTNPLSGAMILTSIVIGLAMSAFIIALSARYFSQIKSISATGHQNDGAP